MAAPLQTIAKNGYLYIYVSNQSPQNVYFDDLIIKHYTGPLLQEQSYYPFGLEMAGISDKAMMKLDSKNKFNGGSEIEEDFGVNLYSTFYRQYDPQIGRFSGVDALAESTIGFNVYQFGNDNPISYNDPTGLQANYGGEPERYMDRWGNTWHTPGVLHGISGLESVPYSYEDEFNYMVATNGGGGSGGGGWGFGGQIPADPDHNFFHDNHGHVEVVALNEVIINKPSDNNYYTYYTSRSNSSFPSNSEGSEDNGLGTAHTIADLSVLSKDLTVQSIKGSQKLANILSGTESAIIDLDKAKLIKGVTVEGAGRALGGAAVLYNVYQLGEHPSIGRGIETVVSIVSLAPGWGWIVGGTYFLADMGWKSYSGKSIQESIDEE